MCGDEVRHGKPAPEIFLKAGELLGVAPEECLVVEDAPSGIQVRSSVDKMRLLVILCSFFRAWRLRSALSLRTPPVASRCCQLQAVTTCGCLRLYAAESVCS